MEPNQISTLFIGQVPVLVSVNRWGNLILEGYLKKGLFCISEGAIAIIKYCSPCALLEICLRWEKNH